MDAAVWFFLLPFLIVISIITGAWAGWGRSIQQSTFVVLYCFVIIGTTMGFFGVLLTSKLPEIFVVVVAELCLTLFFGVHIVTRRLFIVGWSQWLATIPVIGLVVGIVLLFKRTPKLAPKSKG